MDDTRVQRLGASCGEVDAPDGHRRGAARRSRPRAAANGPGGGLPWLRRPPRRAAGTEHLLAMSKGFDARVAFGRQHQGPLRLQPRRIEHAHLSPYLLGELMTGFDASIFHSRVDGSGLMQKQTAAQTRRSAADGEGHCPGDEPGHQADPRPGPHRDPCRMLAAHIERDRPGRCRRHPEQPQNRPPAKSRRTAAPREWPAASRCAEPASSPPRTGVAHRLVPFFRLRLSCAAFGRVQQLRQPARRAITTLRLHGLVTAIAGDFHLSLEPIAFSRRVDRLIPRARRFILPSAVHRRHYLRLARFRLSSMTHGKEAYDRSWQETTTNGILKRK